MENQNVTVGLPRSLLRKVKVVAAKRETSISALLVASLEEIVRRDENRDAVTQRMLARARQGYDLGSAGQLPGRRDELHER